HGAAVKPDPPLRLAPAMTRPAILSAVASAAEIGRIPLHHLAQSSDTRRQAEPIEARANLLPSLFDDHLRHGSGRRHIRCDSFPHGVALLSWIRHPEPTGSRRATPTSQFQQRPGHPRSASVSCTEYRRDSDKMSQCVASLMGANITPELERQVQAALQLYDHSDRHQFDVAIKDILFGMLNTAAGDVYSGAILQLAASAMHSDTKLKEDTPGHNDYVIDEAVAHSWYLKGFYDNALTKNQEAHKDVEIAAFPDEEEKDLAASSIYDRLAATYDRLHQYIDMIVYEKAAIAVGGETDNEHFICYAYRELKQ